MSIGYDGALYLLAFDHRGAFKKAVLGHAGDITEDEERRVRDAKAVVFAGVEAAAGRGIDAGALGVLVDERFGGDIPRRAKAAGMRLAMPVEESDQSVFTFAYGDAFGDHIAAFDPDFAKVLVRHNPEGEDEGNRLQLKRLKRLSDWLRAHDRKLLFELLVPPETGQLERVGGNLRRFEREARPDLTRRAMAEVQDAGIEVDVWKLEGVDRRSDCVMLVEQARREGRAGVACILLGAGADDDTVDHWLSEAAAVDGFVGFAIGRSIWAVPLQGYLAGELHAGQTAAQIADRYERFVAVYRADG
jgi:5-dehydro-2-deoxygluconokinase